ncbi:hypothetical protein HU200_049748 [Digitaria exilis]|uniref:Protein CDI n=1 Tax=Digitaria exilis TaxID=1010633 RepID=A0A835APQ7_9POAL|nr:hypothetical protein HU200_049748 [Digitaria exilis]
MPPRTTNISPAGWIPLHLHASCQPPLPRAARVSLSPGSPGGGPDTLLRASLTPCDHAAVACPQDGCSPRPQPRRPDPSPSRGRRHSRAAQARSFSTIKARHPSHSIPSHTTAVRDPSTPSGHPAMTVSPASPLLPPGGEPFRVFVGYDPREHEAYEVCRRSLLRHATIPLDVRPIRQQDLRDAGLYWRARGPTESTEFSFTRFLTPCLAGYRGWALFVDCDFLYLADIAELLAAAVPPGAAAAAVPPGAAAAADADRLAVVCVKHEYEPAEATKMDGAIQTVYPRKNWSSMVLYNCAHPKNVAALTPDAVSTQTGAFLHRFSWLDDDEIGEVPFVWNFLVGHNKVDPAEPATRPRAIHYTCGGPWFERYRDCEFADLWLKEAEDLRAEKKLKLLEDAKEEDKEAKEEDKNKEGN